MMDAAFGNHPLVLNFHILDASAPYLLVVIIIKNIEIKQQKLGWTTVVASVSQFLFVVVTGRAIDLTESNFVVSNFEMSQFYLVEMRF